MKSARISISHIISLITPLQTARFTAASHLRLGVNQLVVGEPGVGRPQAVGSDDVIIKGWSTEAVGGDNVITGGRLEAAGGCHRLAVAGRLCPRRARLAARLAGPGVTLGWLRTLRIRSDGVRWSITLTTTVIISITSIITLILTLLHCIRVTAELRIRIRSANVRECASSQYLPHQHHNNHHHYCTHFHNHPQNSTSHQKQNNKEKHT